MAEAERSISKPGRLLFLLLIAHGLHFGTRVLWCLSLSVTLLGCIMNGSSTADLIHQPASAPSAISQGALPRSYPPLSIVSNTAPRCRYSQRQMGWERTSLRARTPSTWIPTSLHLNSEQTSADLISSLGVFVFPKITDCSTFSDPRLAVCLRCTDIERLHTIGGRCTRCRSRDTLSFLSPLGDGRLLYRVHRWRIVFYR